LTELTLLRTLERIENLKTNKQWSFRQPKKQRAVGGLVKTHWDYLIDEVKWMRTDFREERKWKLALAHTLAHEVMRWHTAGSHAERLTQGISVSWKRKPFSEDDGLDSAQDQGDPMEIGYPNDQPKSSLLSIDYVSDEEDDDDQDFERELLEQNATVLEEAGRMIHESGEATREQADDSAGPNAFLVLKREEIEDAVAMREPEEHQSQADSQVLRRHTSSKKSTHEGLKNLSTDPILGNALSQPISGEQTPGSTKAKKAPLYPELRDRIAYSDDLHLFLTPEDLIIDSMNTDLVISDTGKSGPPDLANIFSDLQPYDFIDVAPTQLPISEKRKSVSRTEKDDPHKRPEDTTYSKLAPVTKYMYSKPVLLGPLQPARRWKGGAWVNMEDPLPVNEADIPQLKFGQEARSNLFDLSDERPPRQSLPIGLTKDLREPESTKEQRRKAVDDSWSLKDDELLKSLVEKYRTNWLLIAECFNSMRSTVPKSEKRTRWECYNRWYIKWGRDEAEQQAAALNVSAPVSNQVSTRGVKRQNTMTTSSGAAGAGILDAKKRRRHLYVQDAVRKTAKKRELVQKSFSTRKSATIHETHAQYTKMPKLSPIELTRVKAEKDSRDNQEQALRRRNEELSRQQTMPHPSARPPGAPQPGQPQSQVSTRPIPPSQGVPQIRGQVNISQQQRIPTPLSGTNGRITSPLSSAQQTQQAQRALQALAAQSQPQGQVPSTPNGPQTQSQLLAQLQHQPVLNGASTVLNPHMSPPFSARDVTVSPAQSSPPRSSVSLANALTSPRPTSAQASVGHAAQVPGNALPRTANLTPYLGNQNLPSQTHYSPEQLHRMHVQTVLQQAQQVQHAQNQALAQSQGSQNASFPS
jgi:chromatin modification-related protein VID21